MKLHDFVSQIDSQLASSGVYAAGEIASQPEIYGLSELNADQIAAMMTAFQTALTEMQRAEAAYRTAVVSKNEARTAAVNIFNTFMKQSYATATVPNRAFAAIGLDGRTNGPVDRPVLQPKHLQATAHSDGYVNLSWKRGDNTYSTIFVVQAKVEGREWEIVASTTRQKVQLKGYAPGVKTSFRVFAQKGGKTSAPTNTVAIYPFGGAEPRSIAA